MNQRIRYTTVLVACVLAPALGFAQSDKKLGVQLPNEERQFVEMLHSGNETEIELSQLAIDKSPTPEVREFAQMLITDHQGVDQQLMQLAKENKLKVGKPKAQGAAQKAKMEATKANTAKLKQLDGLAFDQSFLATIVERHDHNLAKVTQAQQQYKDSKFAALYQGLVPALTKHRQEGYRLLGKVDGSKHLPGVGGSGEMGGEPMDKDLGTGGSPHDEQMRKGTEK